MGEPSRTEMPTNLFASASAESGETNTFSNRKLFKPKTFQTQNSFNPKPFETETF
jgi:hypothetical protein